MMDGVELLRMIRDGELKEGAEIIDDYGNKYIYDKDEFDDYLTLYNNVTRTFEIPDYSMFIDNKFKIIEKEQANVDIQNIPEYKPTIPIEADNVILVGIINRLVKAVKQLDKEIKDGRN